MSNLPPPPPFIHAPLSDFPSDILKWMKENAAPKMALKLMKCCKYFQHFPEFPFFVVKRISVLKNLEVTTLNYQKRIFEGKESIENLERKFWITEELSLLPFYNIVPSLIPKVAVCDVKSLTIGFQKLSFDEFKVFATSENLIDLFLRETTIKFENGDPVFIDSILKCFPNITNFRYFNNKIPTFSKASIKTLQKIDISKLKKIGLDMFSYRHFKIFMKFMEQNPKIEYQIYFVEDETLSKRQIKKLQNYVQEIIDAGITEYPPPYIRFEEQTPEQRDALRLLLQNYNKKIKK